MSMITCLGPLGRFSPHVLRSLRPLGIALAAGAALLTFEPGAAQAQFWGYGSWYGGYSAPPVYSPAPGYPRGYGEGRLRPGDIADLLRGYGWAILSPPRVAGGRYVANVRTA